MKHFPGIEDKEFIRGNIPMTKQEIRTLVLCKAKIESTAVVIDVGAGTGSLTVEAALLAPQGNVYAIEREAEGAKLISRNAAKFGAENIKIICGAAPGALANLPQADVIFIGGSGGNLAEILTECSLLLKVGGRFVITAITVETLSAVLAKVQQASYDVDCFQVQINRLKKVGSYNMFEALNPIFIITCLKRE